VLPVDCQQFSEALMADPALQPLFEAVNLATRRMVEQVQHAADKLKHDSAVAETQPVTVEVPDSPAGNEVMDDVTFEEVEEMEETDMESILLTAGVTLTEEQRGSVRQKMQEDGVVSKRRKKSRG
jgi:delta-aminolevulinic acid dehydratase/porphobilinogen synthase